MEGALAIQGKKGGEVNLSGGLAEPEAHKSGQGKEGTSRSSVSFKQERSGVCQKFSEPTT